MGLRQPEQLRDGRRSGGLDPTDYYTFGAHNFDTKAALADMLAQATTVNDVRPGEALEQQYGYLPEDGTYGCCNPHGFMSTLLEYDSEDLALAQFAADMGDRSTRRC